MLYVYDLKSSQEPYMVGDINLNSEMSKLRVIEITQLHTSSKWQCWDLNIDFSVFSAVF